MLHGEKEKGAAWDGSHDGMPGCRPAREPGSRRQRGLTEKHGRGLGYLPAVKLPTKLTLPGACSRHVPSAMLERGRGGMLRRGPGT